MSLSVVEFGRQLVETGDLDPVYTMLWEAQLEPRQLRQWLMSYWCFYHSGTASWIAEALPPANQWYWERMMRAAESSDYPRGTERRHFRGELSCKSVKWLADYPKGLDYMFTAFTEGPKPKSLKSVMDYVKTWVGFGDWIAFKVADMLERLDLCQIDFSDADTFLFDSPKEGAEIVAAKYGKFNVLAQSNPSRWAVDYLREELGQLKAPPRFERNLNGQEYETILCKWKSHLNGHYEVGHDIKEIRAGLLRFSTCKLSQRLLKCL